VVPAGGGRGNSRLQAGRGGGTVARGREPGDTRRLRGAKMRGDQGGAGWADSAPMIRARPFGNGADMLAAAAMTPAQREEIERIAAPVSFARGETIYREGDPLAHLYDLVAGMVATYRVSRDGERRITALLFAGDVFGLAEVGRYVNTAEAITEVRAYRLPFRELVAVLEADPKLETNFLTKTCDELRRAQRHAILLDRHGAAKRVALFLQLLRNHGPAGKGTVIPLPMSRSVIADYTGLSIESVSRSLSRLRRDGVIRMPDPRTIEIADPARLRAAAEA
jgi:CRP/FNR family transcriptional regulator, anaerobic regulatory protein